ncbi:hypothetical protein AB0F72_13810 [Actinoplanes sp. NPDC023936]|uniref:hypothetical protein n=1 Tax=Actinoplanes sp. NPDC023936 TaxID=3154910 RepID=UPI0033C7AD18
MPQVSRHELMLRPQYRLIVVRDIDADAAEGRSRAIEEAATTVAAATDYEVVIAAAQELTLVHLEVETWEGPPDTIEDQGWSHPLTFTIDLPTGELLAGDTFGKVIDNIEVPEGPGRHTVSVYHRGRDEAAAAAVGIAAALGAADGPAADALQLQGSGVERYLLRIWRPA